MKTYSFKSFEFTLLGLVMAVLSFAFVVYAGIKYVIYTAPHANAGTAAIVIASMLIVFVVSFVITRKRG